MITQSILRITLRAMVFLLAAVLSSCSKDDDKRTNEFTVDGQSYPIKAVLFLYGKKPKDSPVDGNPYYRNFMGLISDGIEISGNRLKGTGDYASLAMNGASAGLDPGDYTFTGTEDNPKAFELWDATVNLDYAVSKHTGQELTFTSAKLTISKSTDIYTLDMEGIASGKSVKVHYTGPVLVVAD